MYDAYGPDGGGAVRGMDLCRSEVIRVLEEPSDLRPGQLLVLVEPFEAADVAQVDLDGVGGKGNAGEELHHVRFDVCIEVRLRRANEVGVEMKGREEVKPLVIGQVVVARAAVEVNAGTVIAAAVKEVEAAA